MRLKTVHLYSDLKFEHQLVIFEGKSFENVKVYVNNSRISRKSDTETIVIEPNSGGLKELGRLCENIDLIVLYDLDIFKMKVALTLPTDVKIAWRFFGHELYHLRRDLFLSEKSLKLFNRKTTFLGLNFRNIIQPLYDFITEGVSGKAYVMKAMRRIDFIVTLSKIEYDFLKLIWPELPTFIQFPHYYSALTTDKPDFGVLKVHKKPIIILGNSKMYYNNHLDIFQLIDGIKNKKNYDFRLLFSYGKEGNYAREVRKQISGKEYYNLIENFMNKEDFQDFYNHASGLVINSYRQLAGANIRLAFRTGVKVYLNNKSVHKKWLQEEGFNIYSIEDLKEDIECNNLIYDEASANENYENLKKFKASYTIADFQQKVVEMVKGQRLN